MDSKNKFLDDADENSNNAVTKIDSELQREFFSSRNILIRGPIDRNVSFDVMLRLIHFAQEDSLSPIRLYIDSEGGEVYAGLTIIDTMNLVKAPIYTVCYGMACSMAAFILAAGEKGHRYATEHSLVMIHQPLSMLFGNMKQNDLDAMAKSIKKARQTLETILSKATGKTLEECHESIENDNFMSASEAKDMGIIDEILEAGRIDFDNIPFDD